MNGMIWDGAKQSRSDSFAIDDRNLAEDPRNFQAVPVAIALLSAPTFPRGHVIVAFAAGQLRPHG